MSGIIKNKFFIGQTVFASHKSDFMQVFTGEITRIEVDGGELLYLVRDNYGYQEYPENQLFTTIEDVNAEIIKKLQNEVEEAYERLKRFREKMGNE